MVAERDGLLAFIEVKARPSLAEAAFALGPRQRARLVAAAECWLAENPGPRRRRHPLRRAAGRRRRHGAAHRRRVPPGDRSGGYSGNLHAVAILRAAQHVPCSLNLAGRRSMMRAACHRMEEVRRCRRRSRSTLAAVPLVAGAARSPSVPGLNTASQPPQPIEALAAAAPVGTAGEVLGADRLVASAPGCAPGRGSVASRYAVVAVGRRRQARLSRRPSASATVERARRCKPTRCSAAP